MPLFELADLDCEYVAGQSVLNISNLTIDKGKLYFLVGPSGIGKSTFIETLGLMNMTVRKNGKSKFDFHNSDDEIIDVSDLWSQGNEQLSSFRLKYFSFIFQNTNLLPNFTAGENMIMPLLMKGESSLSEMEGEVKSLMKKIDLPEDAYDRPVTQLSGGQRQRLAFVRAFLSPFEILFGDEPTGNLDRLTANKLMSTLKDYLKSHNKTGIIVSHDIQLAADHADNILYFSKITRSDESVYGYIDQSQILHRDTNSNTWMNASGVEIEKINDHLETLLH